MNKKLYPWIPLIGIPLTLMADSRDTGIDTPLVNVGSAVIQGLCLVAVFITVLHLFQ